jgi:hypothetical protein
MPIPSRTFLAILLLAIAGPLGVHAPQDPASRPGIAALLAGVGQIASPGVPGAFCVFGPRAFPVVAGRIDRDLRAPVVAAAEYGRGRIVAFGHGGYFESAAVADTGRLLANAIRWAARSRSPANSSLKIAIVGARRVRMDLSSFGVTLQSVSGDLDPSKLATFDALVTDPFDASDDEVKALAQFAEDGGGLVVAGLGWGWLQLHHGKSLADYPANRLLVRAGILYSDATVGPVSGKSISAAPEPSELLQATRALDVLLAEGAASRGSKMAKRDLAQAAFTLSLAARTLPSDDRLLRPRIAELVESRSPVVPTPERPVRTEDALDRTLLTLQLRALQSLPPERCTSHPSSSAFPGPVPAGAARVARDVAIDAGLPGWQSTGLYAPAGEVITITVPGSSPESLQGATIQIGCHTDALWNLDTWKRVPEIVTTAALRSGVNRVASAFGGLIYIQVRANGGVARAKLAISGAVEAPWFRLGTTTNDEWKASLRQHPAPWAELQTSKIVLTVPAADIRSLDDPEALMKYWDSVADGAADLYGRSRERERAERYVADVQISAGYMHSGYPIMTHLDAGPLLTDLKRMRSGGAWGPYHELGHNHQEGDWTFEGTGEVTNNIFSMYAIEVIAGASVKDGDRSPEKRAERIGKYVKGGRKFETWKSEPFLALDMYMQVKEAFGWDIYKKIFAEYRNLPRASRPRNDAAKRDQWMLRLSKAANRNLGPFFDAWGVPVSDEARKEVAGLDPWMPGDMPAR